LDMATVDAAMAVGAGNELGSIEPGKKADIVIIDCGTPEMVATTAENAVANLVYSSPSGSVRDTIVDGGFVLKNRKIVTMDESKFLKKAITAAESLLDRVKKQ